MILSRRATAPAVAAVVGVALALAGCAQGDEGTSDAAHDAPTVVATTSIWADVARNVACDGAAEVVSIVPPGADPHAFEPSLRDREVLDDAALIVANGLGLEESLTDLLDTVDTPIVDVTDHVSTLISGDPHVWQDPRRVAEAVPAIGEAFVAAGLPADDVRDCVDAYVTTLEALDADVAAVVATVPAECRVLVTNHDALAYFADRYEFEVLGTVIPADSALAETNPADLEELAALVAATGVPAIFAEEQRSADDAVALADRIGGVEVVTLTTDALGAAGTPTATYAGLMRSNVSEIARALTSCRPPRS